jgi:L-lactate dehydrogenase (cytochrome)
VHLDTGIMSGADIVASVALGARFTLIGRAYLYGLMAGGRRGVDKTIEILRNEIVRTMTLLEVATLDELGPQHVTQLARLTPIAKPVTEAAEAATSTKPKTVRSPRPASASKSAASKAASAKPASRSSVTK